MRFLKLRINNSLTIQFISFKKLKKSRLLNILLLIRSLIKLLNEFSKIILSGNGFVIDVSKDNVAWLGKTLTILQQKELNLDDVNSRQHFFRLKRLQEPLYVSWRYVTNPFLPEYIIEIKNN